VVAHRRRGGFGCKARTRWRKAMVPAEAQAPAKVEAAHCVVVACGRSRGLNEGHGRGSRGRWGGRREEAGWRGLVARARRSPQRSALAAT
jgi:hypothetical protein